MCARVARHPAEWSTVIPLSIDQGMPNELPQTFARRARLSSKAIIAAVALTLAALIAIAIAASDKDTTTTVKTLSPVTHMPVEEKSALVPVVNR